MDGDGGDVAGGGRDDRDLAQLIERF
jgi:hypothetical protein